VGVCRAVGDILSTHAHSLSLSVTQNLQSDRSVIPYMRKSNTYPPSFPHEMGACNEIKSQLKALYEAERKRLGDEGAKK